MYNIAICDDDITFCKKMSALIQNYLVDKHLIAKQHLYTNGKFLIEDVKNNMYFDIFILDIEMPNITGIDIARKIREHLNETIIIFVTSHLQYTITSFELEIFRYIPKESLNSLLPIALHAAFTKLNCQEGKYYSIINSRRAVKIFFKDIIYIYKNGKNSIFVLNSKEIKIREPLFKVYTKLNADDFIKADRCYIVNIRYIYTVDSVNSQLTLKNNITLDISKNRIMEIKNIVNLFWGNII